MPTDTEFLVQIRDEANVNVLAVAAVRNQMIERRDVIETWAPSPVRSMMLARLERAIRGCTPFANDFISLRTGANQSAEATGGTVPPIPEEEPGGIVWSTDEW